jgi:hypothetical protein
VSQTVRILALLRERPEGITALDALAEVGCFRLAARIKDLRDAGKPIVSRDEALPNGKHVARYVLVEPQPSLWP